MSNLLLPDRQRHALRWLVEGATIRSVSRATGIHQRTIANHLVRFGNRCRDLDNELRNLNLRHVQCDEIWTFVRKKQRRLHVDERRLPDVGDMYLWVAEDTDTKLIPSFMIGKRSSDMARRFMVDLAGRIKTLETGERVVIQLSTDAFIAYREAVDLAFSQRT